MLIVILAKFRIKTRIVLVNFELNSVKVRYSIKIVKPNY